MIGFHPRQDPISCVELLPSMDTRGPMAVVQDGRARYITPLEAERVQGFPDGWTNVDGLRAKTRHRMLANACSVPVVEWIGRRILELDRELER